MRMICSCILALIITLVPLSVLALSPNQYPASNTGIDVSWPQQNCQIVSHARPKAAFAIIGVNHGLDFTGNTCLVEEASSFDNYSLYLNTGYPGSSYGLKYQSSPEPCSSTNNKCLAFNYGFNDVKYSLTYADLHNVHTTNWWLDVETDNSWTTDPTTNVAALLGMIAALRYYTFLSSIGFYSLPGQWNQLTNDWRSGLPVWAATGSTSQKTARKACHESSFTAGKIVLTQYTLKLDEDYAC
jgi:hypothetical protein